MKPLLIVENLKVWYPLRTGLFGLLGLRGRRYVRAVDGVNLTVGAGETFCLVGESGCGKSTLLRAVMMLVDRDSIAGGRILFRPHEEVLRYALERQPHAVVKDEYIDIYAVRGFLSRLMRREIQIVFQDPYGSLNPRMKVREIIEEPLLVHGVKNSEERLKRVIEVMRLVRLDPPEEFLDRYPHQLSGGQRQRVAIARAVVLNPRLLLADEPVTMLDVSIKAEVLQVLERVKKERGLSILFVTHDLALARYVCDRVGIMYLGKIVEVGKVDEVIESPLHPYTKALIKAVPDVAPELKKVLKEVPIKGEVTSAVNIPLGCRFRPRCVEYDANEWVRPRCEREEPELREVTPGHWSACWLHR
ncbi:MAG: ABC transporter ATP-binding protein [Acidilobaceae archaeon]